jgi:MIP family channel proteins
VSGPGISLLRRGAAELAGTFALVLAGCGAIVVDQKTGALGHGGVAASFGLVILIMIATFGHLSGAHFNPAVTVAFALIRHFRWRDVPVYVAGQLAGATLGALALRGLFGAGSGLGATVPSGSAGQAFAVEFLLTATLMLVITAVATDTRAVGQLAAIAIGATVALDALWGGPVTGASMNPARSFGPALVTGLWPSHWIYWLAPLMGACGAAAFYQLVRVDQPPRR